jgi:hypothetical protein
VSDEKGYIKQFKVFESEVDVGFNNIVLHFGINRISIKNTEPLQSSANFWNYSLYNAATVSIMTLGRIFDNGSPYNIHELLISVGYRDNDVHFLSHESLRQRKDIKFFDKYIEGEVEFSKDDFRRISNEKKRIHKKYKDYLVDYRHSLIGHRLVEHPDELNNKGQFKYIDILDIYLSLYNIKMELWSWYHNGRDQEKIAFEDLENLVDNIDDPNIRVPEYIWMVKDFWKLYSLLSDLNHPTN